jgi:hypothetical protein
MAQTLEWIILISFHQLWLDLYYILYYYLYIMLPWAASLLLLLDKKFTKNIFKKKQMCCSDIYSKLVELTPSINTIRNLRPILSIFAWIFQKYLTSTPISHKILLQKNIISFIFQYFHLKNLHIKIILWIKTLNLSYF